MSGSGEGKPHRPRTVCGAGLSEHLLILAGISMAAVAVFSAFGDTMRHRVAAAALEVAGLDGAEASLRATVAAERARGAAAVGGSFFGGNPGRGSGSG